jgi:membrane protein YdbS with pleckstrin-like domain
MPDKQVHRDKPLLRLRSHFVPLLVFCHHPVRLAVSLAIPAMLLPELRTLLRATAGLDAQGALLAAVAGIVLVVFLPQFLGSAIACRKVRYDFYRDRVEYNENYLLPDVIRLSYKSVTGVRMEAGPVQRLFGVADIILTLQGRTGRAQKPQEIRQVIPDVRGAPEAMRRLEKIFTDWDAAHREGAAPAVKASADSPPRP